MSIEIKLEHFEGPLDALLKLIDKNQIDIYDIPIATLTDDYLNYIKNNDLSNNMNDISKFILMASYLLEIKSKMLLPKEVDEVTKLEIDPRNELMLKLLEYRKYKDVAEELSKIEVFSERVIFKSPDYKVLEGVITSGETYNKSSIEEEVSDALKEENIQELLNGLTLKELYATFEKIIRDRDSKKDKIRSEFKSVTKSLYSINEKMIYIKDLIFLYDMIEFERVFEESACKQEVVVTFLAMLELIKTREIRALQDENFSKIMISLNKKK
ncbi:MAG: segregation/condensation protein A [bacterium]